MSSPDRAKSATRDFSISHSKGPPPGESATSLLFQRGIDSEHFRQTTARAFVHVVDKEEAYDPTGQMSYMEACEMLQVVPASCVLRQMQTSELSMMHRGLGPQVL